MKTQINASILSQLLDFIKNISSNLSKTLNSLLEAGAEYENAHKDKDGNVVFTVTVYTGDADNKKKHQFKVKVIPLEKKKDKVELHFKHPNGSKITKVVKDDKRAYDKAFQSVAKEWFGIDSIEDAIDQTGKSLFESKQMNVTLKKIQCSDNEESIDLVAINCSYNPVEALDTLNLVLDDDAFVQALSDEPSSFHICEDSDEFIDVEECDSFEIDASSQLICILRSACKLICDALYFSWVTTGDDLYDLNSICDAIRYDIQYQMDSFAKHAFLEGYTIPHPNELFDGTDTDSEGYTIDKRFAFTKLIEDANAYACAMDLYCCNMPEYIHKMCSDYILTVKNNFIFPMERYFRQ